MSKLNDHLILHCRVVMRVSPGKIVVIAILPHRHSLVDS